MEKIKENQFLTTNFKLAVVPIQLIKNFIINRSIRCAGCFILAVVLLLPVSILPGLALFVVPAEIAVIGKIHDEVQLIQWVRWNALPRRGCWEDAENETEISHTKSLDRRDSTLGYMR
ncbi:MAG: hypothetical protein JW779_03825 [Candidatus Thorarchaeota archaeon]|nr:hypothetical protein [Candidatus Thorarchaeota archaeon]